VSSYREEEVEQHAVPDDVLQEVGAALQELGSDNLQGEAPAAAAAAAAARQGAAAGSSGGWSSSTSSSRSSAASDVGGLLTMQPGTDMDGCGICCMAGDVLATMLISCRPKK
jgi:hypothetical protein